MNDEDFKRLFRKAAPPDRTPEGVVDGARRKRRRSRAVVGLVAVAAVVAVAVPAALSFRGGDAVVAEPSPTASVTVETTVQPGATATPATTPEACSNLDLGDPATGELSADETLPEGAERVWWCVGGGWGHGPLEPLETDPDRVVALINSAPLPPEPIEACPQVGALSYHLVVEYLDGSRSVSVETRNCEWVGGWGNRIGGAALHDSVEQLWTAQRATLPDFKGEPDLCSDFPQTAEEALHPRPGSVLWRDPAEATRAAACGLAENAASYDGPVHQIWLPDTLAARIAAAFATGDARTVPTSENSLAGLPHLVFLNRHGDPLTAFLEADGTLRFFGDTWALPPGVTDDLLASVGALRTDPLYIHSPLCIDAWRDTSPQAGLGDVVGGIACIDEYVLPELGPELDPELATRVATTFDAEAVPASGESEGVKLALVLQDADGRNIILAISADGTSLVWEERRTWQVPDALRDELRRYGLSFEPTN